MLGETTEKIKNFYQPKPIWWKRMMLVGGILFLIFFGLAAYVWGYTRYYEGKVYPGVYVGSFHLGGMTASEVKNFIEAFNNRLAKEGINLLTTDSNGQTTKINIANVQNNSDSALELVHLNSEALVAQAIGLGRDNAWWWQNYFQPLKMWLFGAVHLSAPITVQENFLSDNIKAKLSAFEDQPHNAGFQIKSLNPLSYDLVSEKTGRMFNITEIMSVIHDQSEQLSLSPISVLTEKFSPTILAAELTGPEIGERLNTVFGYGNLGLNFINPQTKQRFDWVITTDQLSGWIELSRSEEKNIILSLNTESVNNYLENSIASSVDQSAQDAKFTIVDGKVKEFLGSQPGLKLNYEKTFQALKDAFENRNSRPVEAVKTVSVVYDLVEPDYSLADVNDMGIVDVVGVGYSTFRDSHTNRIKNIAHAVERLNGTLVKPGEIFSTIKSAGPFDAENGFLPEEVIKGNTIKKEIGGGMCQIGTTLFRMAMNSGMPITERRNHSLVVGYYADPVNGNPGTDATIYEPILDFKFLNDTGNYLLLQTNIDYKKQQLTFTLWGKSDGRKGSYTHPLVSKWIPAGPEQEVESETLKPGERKCQNAFRGAIASFTYSRVTPTGEKIDQVFDSYYRPLPRICMVAKGEIKQVCADGTTTCDVSEPVVPVDVPVEETEVLVVTSTL